MTNVSSDRMVGGPFGDSGYGTQLTLLQSPQSAVWVHIVNGEIPMSDQLQRALSRRRELLEELSMIEKYLELHERLFGHQGAISGPAQTHERREAHAEQAQTEASEKPKVARRGNDPKLIVEKAIEILSEAPRPMSRGKILNALAQMGFSIQSKDRSKYLGTVLWRNPQHFINVEGHGYWLKNRPLPDDLENSDPLFR